MDPSHHAYHCSEAGQRRQAFPREEVGQLEAVPKAQLLSQGIGQLAGRLAIEFRDQRANRAIVDAKGRGHKFTGT